MEKARDSATEENNINPTTIFGDIHCCHVLFDRNHFF